MPAPQTVVREFSATDLFARSSPDRLTPPASSATNPLERLAQLVIANDRLMDELTTSRARIVSARAYLDRPGCNVSFGSAHLERCRDKHAGILAQLRANRIESLRLLGEGNSAR
jgi:hypothetical protein